MKETSLFRTIIDNVNDGVYFVDLERRISLWNKAAETITGYTASEVMGRHCQDNILSHMDKDGRPLCELGCPLYFSLGDGEEREDEVLLLHKDGHRVLVKVRIIPVYTSGQIVGAVEVFTPLEEKEKNGDDTTGEPPENKMKDQLTELPSRAYMESYINYKLQESQRFGERFCVVFADLDNFEVFNNYYGRETGDVAMQSIAASFKNNISDIIGRWDSEEFVGVFDVKTDEDPYNAAEKVRTLISRSGVIFAGEQLSVTASVGATVAQPGDTTQAILDRAVNYMQQSKRRGKNCSTIDLLPPNMK